MSMAFLEMYLDNRLLDSASVWLYSSNNLFSEQIKGLKEGLLKKYSRLLSKSDGKPVFLLSGISSCMNNFISLGTSKKEMLFERNDGVREKNKIYTMLFELFRARFCLIVRTSCFINFSFATKN